MLDFLAKKRIKNYQDKNRSEVQSQYISLSGLIGLGINILLFLIKFILGMVTNSISVISDSFNNLSDSLTSIVTVLGSRFSSKPADENHPHGHGRLEYVASFVIAIIIMFVGIQLFLESIGEIRNPSATDFSLITVLILAFTILAKFYMYSYNIKLYREFDSSMNEGVAKDSLNDTIATAGVIIAGLITKFTGLQLDGFAGLLISLMVFKSGLDFASSTVSLLVGEKPSEDLFRSLEGEILKTQYVKGYHDMEVHDYGRGMVVATVDVEIPADISVIEAHEIIDELERRVMDRLGVTMVIHMDPSYTLRDKTDSCVDTILCEVKDVVKDSNCIEEAASAIKNGGLAVMPTETVYGLAADGMNLEAIKKIFDAKGRPADNPLILHIGKKEDLDKLVKEVPKEARLLIDRLWPGPLTIILKKSDLVSDIISGGGDTVAVRMPKNEVALKLIELVGSPLAAPSANISGRPSPTNALDVYDDLSGKVDIILDGGPSNIGIESTVVDLSAGKVRILRPGYYGVELLKDLIPGIAYDQALIDKEQVPKSPGQKYKHYSPRAELYIYSQENPAYLNYMEEKLLDLKKQGLEVGVLADKDDLQRFKTDHKISISEDDDLEDMARHFFAGLRELDREGVDVILSVGPKEEGLGFAIMNRMKKASGGKVIK